MSATSQDYFGGGKAWGLHYFPGYRNGYLAVSPTEKTKNSYILRQKRRKPCR
jgi:hypothetical protein